MAANHKKIITKTKTVLGAELTLSGYNDDFYYWGVVKDQEIYDEDLLLALRESQAVAPAGAAILDVGANIGYISCMLAKFYPKAKLYSFEPVPSNIKILQKNITQNNLHNVTACPFGLATEAGTVSLSWDPDNRGSAFVSGDAPHERYPEHEEAEIKVLDDEFLTLGIEDCQLVKVDIEGYELEFLRGAKAFLKKNKPTVIMEANHWCLNALHNITLPDFLDEIFDIFPFVHGFWGNKVIDVRANREIYMHENIVNNHYMNIICSFDKEKHESIVKNYLSAAAHLNYENSRDAYIEDLKEAKETAESQLQIVGVSLRDKEEEVAFLQRQQRDVRFLAKQLAGEVQLRLNKRAKSINKGSQLKYKSDPQIQRATEQGDMSKEEMLAFIQSRDQANITKHKVSFKQTIKAWFWKVAAAIVKTTLRIAKKVAVRLA